MSKYEKTFHSTSGEEFRADVYSVLEAFGVTCPAVQHAIKKLLMPGQRGSKDEVQDLDEAITSVARAVEMAYARLRDSDGANGDTEPIAEAEPVKGAPVTRPAYTESTVEPRPKLVTWRKCVRIAPNEINDAGLIARWHPSGNIPDDWYPIEAQSQPVETVKQLPEGQRP